MGTHQYDFDYFVIGAGSGGVRSARIAAGNGAKVGIAEAKHLGGTCVNVGCVPKKLMSYASHFSDDFHASKGFGWSFDKEPEFSWANFIDQKNKEIQRLNDIYGRLLENSGVTLYNGFARFLDPHTLDIDGERITADKILIATGGRPFIPDHEGAAEHAITSDDIFFLKDHPGKVLINGGGYIGVEFASILNGLGCDVHLIHRGELFLRGFDLDLRTRLHEIMSARGVQVNFNCNLSKIEAGANNQKIVHFTDGRTETYDTILYATGRLPNTDKLGLDKAGLKTNKKGGLLVNEKFQTNQDNIYALGDVINRIELTPVAIQEGHFLADYLFKEKGFEMHYENIPTAVFTTPPIGTVGLTEHDALESYDTLDIYESSFRPMQNILAGSDEKTYMKLIVAPETDLVLGCHMLGPDSPEIIQMAGIALKMCATKADFDATMAVHPSAAEEFVTMRSVSRQAKRQEAA